MDRLVYGLDKLFHWFQSIKWLKIIDFSVWLDVNIHENDCGNMANFLKYSYTRVKLPVALLVAMQNETSWQIAIVANCFVWWWWSLACAYELWYWMFLKYNMYTNIYEFKGFVLF